MFTFQLLNNNIYSYTIKSHLALGNLAKLVFWSILLLKIEKFVSVFFGDRIFLGNKRKYFTYIWGLNQVIVRPTKMRFFKFFSVENQRNISDVFFCLWIISNRETNFFNTLFSVNMSNFCRLSVWGLIMTWYSEKMMISNRCICGFMPNFHK